VPTVVIYVSIPTVNRRLAPRWHGYSDK